MTVEIEFGMEREIGRDFEIAGAAEKGIVEIDVILLDRFSLPAVLKAQLLQAGAVVNLIVSFSRF